MYVRITYPKIQAFDNNGNLAVGYEIHTFHAGLATALTTYSDRLLTVPNTNPVVLDARGEANIYVGEAAKLIFTIPGGDPTSPIWSVDYVGEMQANPVTGIAGTVTGFTENLYTVDTTPAVLTLTPGLMLNMIPDGTNLTTLEEPTFVAGSTGPNDLVVSGSWTGATPSTYRFEIDGAYEDPPGACVDTVSLVVGTCTAGAHLVRVTFVNASGETELGTVSGGWTSAGTDTCDLTDIPVSPNDQVTARRIYMTEAAGTDYYFVAEIANNVDTTYTIDVSDAVLVTQGDAPTGNTTGNADSFKWNKDGGAYSLPIPITADGTPQTIELELKVLFATKVGHVLGAAWTVATHPAVRVNLDSLGALLVQKNKGAFIKGLDAGDIIDKYPAQLVLNSTMTHWLLINPATPVFSTSTIQAVRYRKILSGDYPLVFGDQGYELDFTGTHTLTLLTPPEFDSRFFYVTNSGSGLVTVDAGVGYLIYGPLIGSRYFYVGPGSTFQLQSNGVDWHVMTSNRGMQLIEYKDITVAAGSALFENLVPGTKYKMVLEVRPEVRGSDVIGMFNEDAGANYASTTRYQVGAGVATAEWYQNGFKIAIAAYETAATIVTAEYEFSTLGGLATSVKVGGSCYAYVNAVGWSATDFRSVYTGAADLTSTSIVVANNFKGKLWLYQID